MNRKKFLDRLVANRFRSNKEIRKILEEQRAETTSRRRRARRDQQYLTGVHNGVYYRIKVPPSKPRILPDVPRLPSTPISAPKPLQRPEPAGAQVATMTRAERRQDVRERLWEWLLKNYPTLILNFGSICTLAGFTRSDVLELRGLAVTGSLCAVVYHLTTPPIRFTPILWSSTFAAVNSFKIYEIMEERRGSVNLTTEQEERYINFFMNHGVTPKQFETIDKKADLLHIEKGTCIVKQHEALEHVYLVVSGTTRASILGRFLTAASTTPTAHEEHVGGASGAWVGEMAFLEQFWAQEQGKVLPKNGSGDGTGKEKEAVVGPSKGVEKKEPVAKATTAKSVSTGVSSAKEKEEPKKKKKPPTETAKEKAAAVVRKETPIRKAPTPIPTPSKRSMYTIVAQEDCTVLRWSHRDMAALMEKSTDMRAALTRAMTAAIVGKVINFTVSRSAGARTWSTWLDDWKHPAAEAVQIETKRDAKDDEDDKEDVPDEGLPHYPIKKFR
jgi:CRP-like cAMP-binding protein